MDWLTFEKEITKLIAKIDYKPDIVIGVVRGGVIPAGVLADALNVKVMYCIMVKKIGEKRVIATEIVENLNEKNILLVEDSIETGRSLSLAADYLAKKGASVKTVCLYKMDKSEVTPNYSLGTVSTIPDFPWE